MSRLFILVGPSGAGKTTVLERLQTLPDFPLHRALTTTTRAPRPGEADGKDFWFVTTAVFQQMIDANAFIEWVDNFDRRYGTSRQELERGLATDKPVILITDMDGARRIRSAISDTTVLFLDAPQEQLIERIRERAATPEELAKRIKKFAIEKASAQEADVLIENANGNLDATVQRVADVIRSRYHAT
jgi:guanylate kinase